MVPLSSLENAFLGFVEIRSRHLNLKCRSDSTKLFYGDENIDASSCLKPEQDSPPVIN